MRTKLLKRVRSAAKYCAHIDRISYEWNAFRITGWSASVGYATQKERDTYKDILSYGMNEQTFDRLVRQRYWELHRKEFIEKYRKQ